jgi:hypothetical protein
MMNRLLILLLICANLAFTASSSKYTGTASSGGTGTVAWTGPTYAQGAADNIAAYALLSNNTSRFLICTNFGFAIPTGATITGIQFNVVAQFEQTGDGTINMSVYEMIKSDTTIGVQGLPDTPLNLNSFTTLTYGSTTATTLYPNCTYTDINDADFGVQVKCGETSASAATAHIDAVSIDIYYTEASGLKRRVIGCNGKTVDIVYFNLTELLIQDLAGQLT